MRFSVVGLGKLGASMAAAIANRGYEVVGVDVNPRSVELVNQGHAPVQETDLESPIAKNHKRLRATHSYGDAILNTDLTFVIVPTPSDERGAFSLQYAATAFRDIGQALASKKDYHNVVLTSTVLPGATRHGLMPIIERESGKKCGRDFGLCYSPEFIALGSVIRDFLNPDFTLIGEIDERAGAQLETCYQGIMENKPPCRRMSFENAELAKIAVNSYVTMKITFANMLANICERIQGGDIDVVTSALGTDKRISRHYLKGALGYGGPCFPRDNVALSFVARSVGTTAELAEVTDRANRSLPKNLVAGLSTHLRKGMKVAVLGLSYKPLSSVVEESQAMQIVEHLAGLGFVITAYDPLANEPAAKVLGGKVSLMDSIAACVKEADAVIIANPDPVFAALTADDFRRPKTRVLVLDCWRMLSKALSGQDGIDYIPYGCSRDEAFNT
ncbi:MAG: nucleotide sugar dehydrogenase, partial [bacterium]